MYSLIVSAKAAKPKNGLDGFHGYNPENLKRKRKYKTMKKARIICKDHIVVNGTIIHIENMNHAHMDWMNRNGLTETETVETDNGQRFTVWANWARHLACAIPV